MCICIYRYASMHICIYIYLYRYRYMQAGSSRATHAGTRVVTGREHAESSDVFRILYSESASHPEKVFC